MDLNTSCQQRFELWSQSQNDAYGGHHSKLNTESTI